MKVVASAARRRRTRRSEPAQQVLFKKRGGKRRGAGRKPKGRRAGSPHKARPELKARHPVHVVLRVIGAVGSLRRRFTYRAIREATLTTARRDDFRVVHVSIQRTHVHLLVEADGKRALASGMQGFQISAAKHLNAAISKGKPGPRRRGTVFPDRYHAEIITSPRQARHALAYVLLNWRKHQEDRKQPMSEWKVDWFSTAAMFPGCQLVVPVSPGGQGRSSSCGAAHRTPRRRARRTIRLEAPAYDDPVRHRLKSDASPSRSVGGERRYLVSIAHQAGDGCSPGSTAGQGSTSAAR
jgi:REP element-mobilizing transposase RayT